MEKQKGLSNETKSKIFMWLYRIFCYYVPGGVALWTFLIEQLIDGEVPFTRKIGLVGITILIIIFLIAIFFYGKHFKTAIDKETKANEELTDKILLETDETIKSQLLMQKNDKRAKIGQLKAKQELFHNACFIAPFIIGWILCCLIEKGVVSLRGTLLIVSISMASGFGFNGLSQWLKTKK